MPVGITHIESWSVAITPDEGEEWPVIHGIAGRNDLRPDLILIQVIPGQPLAVSGSGRRLRNDGTVGSLRVDAPWILFENLPEWAARKAVDALRGSGLDQQVSHEITPMPGSVRGRNLLRIKDGCIPDNDALYPVTGICSYCHDSIWIYRMGGGWEPRT